MAHNDVFWTEYHYFELVFYTVCLHKHISTENRQEGRQDNEHFLLGIC